MDQISCDIDAQRRTRDQSRAREPTRLHSASPNRSNSMPFASVPSRAPVQCCPARADFAQFETHPEAKKSRNCALNAQGKNKTTTTRDEILIGVVRTRGVVRRANRSREVEETFRVPLFLSLLLPFFLGKDIFGAPSQRQVLFRVCTQWIFRV